MQLLVVVDPDMMPEERIEFRVAEWALKSISGQWAVSYLGF